MGITGSFLISSCFLYQLMLDNTASLGSVPEIFNNEGIEYIRSLKENVINQVKKPCCLMCAMASYFIFYQYGGVPRSCDKNL